MKKYLSIILTFCFLKLISQSILTENISNGLLLDYNFDNNTSDNSGNSFDATIYGATYTIDRFGNPSSALYFDGIDDYIEFPNNSMLKPQLPVSFSFWIKYDSTFNQDREVINTSFEENRSTGVSFNAQSSTGNFAINFGDGTYNYTSSTRRTYVTNSSIQIDTWYHIAVIVSSATDMKIYVDCVDYGGSYSGTGGNLVYSNTPGGIGRHDRHMVLPANYFKGTIDDFKYWSRAISINEVNNLCNSLNIEDNTLETINDLSIFPNPSKNGFFELNKKFGNIESYRVYDSFGKLICNKKYQSNELNLSSLSNGVYFIEFKTDENIFVKKVIINKY